MAFRWFKLSLESAIAVGNLVLVGLALLLFLELAPASYLKFGEATGGGLILVWSTKIVLGVLTFPLGLLAIPCGPGAAALFCLLAIPNAYLWGHVGARLIRRRRLNTTSEDPASDGRESPGEDASR